MTHSHRHALAVVEHRGLGKKRESRILSTHKTRAAAERVRQSGERIIHTRHTLNIPCLLVWWPD